MTTNEKRLFINRHSLPEAYLQQASLWFDPMIESLIKHQKEAKKTLVIGINGCQGSGKTTLADYFSSVLKMHDLNSIAISLDDFYLSHEQRQKLSKDVHPLLATRGVPGTHDINLALATVNALKTKYDGLSIPRFDKAKDDRFPLDQWSKVDSPVDVIILEGWCLGVEAQGEQSLVQAVNQLESLYDAGGSWRDYVNQQIKHHYSSLWQQIDCLIMLQAPSFECVYEWRLEQEKKLGQHHQHSHQQATNKIMSADQIEHFIQFYERLTRHSLVHLPERCQHVFVLNNQRLVVDHRQPKPFMFGASFDRSTRQTVDDL